MNRSAGAALNTTFAPRATFPEPGSSMSHSCEDRYFLCRKSSRMCADADAEIGADARLDSLSAKALFLGCAESLCAPNASSVTAELPSKNSTACGLALVALYHNLSGAAGPAVRLRSRRPARAAGVLGPEAAGRGLAASASCERAWTQSRGGELRWVAGRRPLEGVTWAWS